ncbi:hypothetical protein QO002_002893 [Pararhizobium capsulatum DSM 1112]|uniref:Uncharacterized protein n=1 Tax=Pararhizobium capsulatum DSM 1112 TaxID=1121113 RepID=A0ABU0BR91_9HYPH|nr:hypothetical protein [Pararhizobium capsulatum]MDQ0320755.1 hypothetical protein [Pararhizobium capsulatum DSM 1112]
MIDDKLAFALFGTTRREAEPRILKAGKLSVQLAGGNLRMISYDGVEVLRAVSYLVRDRDWGTYDPEISGLAVEERDGGFVVSYSARCQGPDETVLDISARIEADAAGRLTFRGEARSTTGFETNRCGLCILHPIVGVAGTAVQVEHVDGSIEDTTLPDLIDPWQPFKGMRAITHTALPGVSVECRMEGDTFEMEDQRNWSDASYKTYVRPLALPWPYTIAANEPVVQQVTLGITDRREGSAASADAKGEIFIRIEPGECEGVVPAIGLIITPEEARASLEVLSRPDAIKVQELLFHFDPLAGHGPEAFVDFAAIARVHQGTTSLEIAVPCQRSLDDELQEIASAMRAAGFAPDAVMVCPAIDRQSTPPGSKWPDCPPLEDVYAAARKAFPGIRLGGGMLSYFTELNRKRVPGDRLSFISHCTNPIVHAADDISVMQTLEALPFVTRSVRAIYGDKSYRIGPSTIPMRQNPYGSRTMDNPDGGRIPMANRDPRHNGDFAEAFAMAYAAQVLDAGLECLTLSALTGPFGLFADDGEPTPAGGRRPLFNAVERLAGFAGSRWQACRSSDPTSVLAFRVMAIETGAQIVLINTGRERKVVDLRALEFRDSASVTLEPYGVIVLALPA